MKRLVLDFSSRLPGPMATALLLGSLFDVIKVEYEGREDPFKGEDLKQIEPLFFEWYQNLNQGKRQLQIKNMSDIENEIKAYDWVIALGSFKKEELDFFNEYQINVLTIKGAKEKKHQFLHDINALLLSSSFRFHQKTQMPYLPFAGINFAQSIRAKILEMALNTKSNLQNEHIYLKEETLKTFDLLKSENRESLHLHNGKFPCYNFYQTKDKRLVALSTIEEHFWNDFCRVFNLKLENEDRFKTNRSVFDQISALFSQYDGQILQDIVDTNGLLITIY